MEVRDPNEFKIMGVWDHFYKNSVLAEGISTHYVNLPHFISMEKKLNFKVDEQHEEWRWFDLKAVASDSRFHEYMQNYASWLIKVDTNND